MQNNYNDVYNIEAEQVVLGCILQKPELIKDATVKADEFSLEKHRIIFKSMKTLDKDRVPIDCVTLVSNLGNITIEQIGGVSFLLQLGESVPSVEPFHFYEGLVKKAFKIRKALQIFKSFEFTPSEDSLYHTLKLLNELTDEGGDISVASKQEVLMEIYDELSNQKEGLSGIDTGFLDLNLMTDGFQKGDLIILAARPSVGKTALALNFAMNACKKNTKVIFFSFEMPQKQLLYRILSSMASINSMFLRQNQMTDEEIDRAANVTGIIDKWDLVIDDYPGQTTFDINLKIRREIRKTNENPCLVIVDYLQLIKTDNSYDRHDLKIAAITRELKIMAKELNVPIILLSQLNRNVEQRADKRPYMSDLRDSGSIEQDADVILLLHRDDYYNNNSDQKNKIEINIAKQRNSPVGPVDLLFAKETGTFLDLSKMKVSG
ncbi:replicative DNA helicase [Priestia megaterium]|nr:replicative DNA helicase [Priestia megaterium]